MKFIFSFLLVFHFVPGKGQKIENAKGIPGDLFGMHTVRAPSTMAPVKTQKIERGIRIPKDSLGIRIVCAPSTIKAYPLIIIDGRRFDGSYLQHLFFSVNDIESINVIGPKKDTIKYFGKSAQNGIIILNMKHPMTWVTSADIVRQQFSELLINSGKILFEVDGIQFPPGEILYFANDFIKTITVNYAPGFCDDKPYQKKITVTTFKQRDNAIR